ncbi:MAG: class I SAM-dependent DNA methyltransferase [Chloroflexota bacterium]
MKLPDTSYAGRHAELYDLFYAQKPYAEEALFVHECIQKYAQGPAHFLLDLACGTGSHAFEFERFGYQVVAVDYSADMLEQARHKAMKNNSRVQFCQQDMRLLNVSERPFDIVTCLFDSIGYVATNENILQVLKGVHSHLKPNGIFIFEFWHAPAMLNNYEPLRIKRWNQIDRDILRISETELDHARQLAHVSYTVYELFADGTYSTFKEKQTNRYFLLQEMRALLATGGFEPLKAFNGFCEDELITDATWHVLMTARNVPHNKVLIL